MLTIGLTGGIGSGKTTIANLFARLQVPIIDTDIIARAMVAPGTTGLNRIIQHFGPTLLNADDTLNRRQLRNIIFADKAEKLWLEQLLHPLIRTNLQQQIATLNTPYCILVIPLLLENKRAVTVDRILVIDAPVKVQIQRIQARDQITIAEAKKIINSQLSRKQRLAAADDILLNDSNRVENLLIKQVAKLHQFYLSLAK